MIASVIKFLVSNFTITFFFIAMLSTANSILRHRKMVNRTFIAETLLSYYCLWSLGVCAIYNFVMHVFFHEMAASFIGWADSSFQLEVGFASLGFGILGILAFRKNDGLRLGLVIATSTFLWGAASEHLYQIATNDDYAPGDAGVMLWTGLIQPIRSILLLNFSMQPTTGQLP